MPIMPRRAIGRHHADLAHARRQYTLRIRTYETSSRSSQCIANANHIDNRNPLGDDDDKRHFRLDGLDHGVGGLVRRHKDHAGIRTGRPYGLGHAVEDGNVKVRFPALAWRDAGDDPRTELNHAVRVIVPAHPVMPWHNSLVC